MFFGRTLLQQTQARLEYHIAPERTLIALDREHAPYYRPGVEAIDPYLLVEQPSYRGTTPAIIYSLLRVIARDPNALLVFSPSDHHYTYSQPYLEALGRGLEVAREHPRLLLLLGAQAAFPNAQHGLIEPATSEFGGHKNCFRIQSFWDKSESRRAQGVKSRGYLWNTFVTIGTAGAFHQALRSTVPDLLANFEEAMVQSDANSEARNINRLYQKMGFSDFSAEVLPRCVESLLVLKLQDSGWSDLGTPERFIERMSQMGLSSNLAATLAAWRMTSCPAGRLRLGR
jgi:mannose-1-phosphate guanylyltransferase